MQKFMNEKDYVEWIGVSQEIIHAFKHRGYSLYLLGQGNSILPLNSMDLLDDIIGFGPESDVLEIGFRYVVLPLVHEDQMMNPSAVKAAAMESIGAMRGPYFIDLETDEHAYAVPKGAYLIDSIEMQPPFLYMVIDSRFGSQKTGSIELPLATAAHTIQRQLMLSLRAGGK